MPMEESATERAVKNLVAQARRALPSEASATLATGTESAIALLADAVERSVDSSPRYSTTGLVFKPIDESSHDTPSAEQIEELYAKIVDRIEPTGNTNTDKFVISFPEVELSVDEIWQEGDAPEKPTPEDVIEAMREYANPSRVAYKWQLHDSLFVRYHNDKNADMEVEWDGT